MTALAELHRSYPHDAFEAIMRYCALNPETNAPVPLPLPPEHAAASLQFAWLPRIRCRDCPGKSYTAGPDLTVGNFEVHLRNKGHRERVAARLAKSHHQAQQHGQGQTQLAQQAQGAQQQAG